MSEFASGKMADRAGRHAEPRTEETCVIRALSAVDAEARIAALSDILVDCVEGGASVSFMAPLTRERADAFWRLVVEGVASGDRTLLVADDAGTGEMLGTVQLILRQPENQPHRAEVAKMLVRRSARRRGLGALLMRAWRVRRSTRARRCSCSTPSPARTESVCMRGSAGSGSA